MGLNLNSSNNLFLLFDEDKPIALYQVITVSACCVPTLEQQGLTEKIIYKE